MAKRKSSQTRTVSLVLLVVVVLLVVAYGVNSCNGGNLLPLPTIPAVLTVLPNLGVTPAPITTGAPVGGLPDMPTKPKPQQVTFKGCPPEGDGGDPVLNRNKNRVDDGAYVPVAFDALVKLAWPSAIERKNHANWSASAAAAVARYEGIPVVTEGYLAGAKEEGPESPNCHGADFEFHDFHVWLTKNAGEDRSNAIVVETTPRVRAKHPAWTVSALSQIARGQQRVRISGWWMLDPEHPDQLGQTRGTLWEIHPIMLIEVERGGRWVSLDDAAR
ncbi:MAG: hypothetical protein ABI874_00025 [Chloroflexota bacterium]